MGIEMSRMNAPGLCAIDLCTNLCLSLRYFGIARDHVSVEG